jgi:hypothetical protein
MSKALDSQITTGALVSLVVVDCVELVDACLCLGFAVMVEAQGVSHGRQAHPDHT